VITLHDVHVIEQRVVVDGKIVSQLCDEEGNMTALEFKEAMRKQVLTAPAPACMHDRRPRHWASTVDAFSHKSDAALFTRLHVDAFAHKIDAQQVLQSPHEVQRIKPRLSRAALLKSPKT
jgi:hypothetical protein